MTLFLHFDDAVQYLDMLLTTTLCHLHPIIFFVYYSPESYKLQVVYFSSLYPMQMLACTD